MVNIILGIAVYVSLIAFIIWLYFIYPWYLGKHLKYDAELQKAQRISRFKWFYFNAGTSAFYRCKIDYELIKNEILQHLILVAKEDSIYLVDEVAQSKQFTELNLEMQINVIYSIFLQEIEPNPYEEYFFKYNLEENIIAFRVYPEVKTLKILSIEELTEFGMLKYKDMNFVKYNEESV